MHYLTTVQGILCFDCAKADALGLIELAKKSELTFIFAGFKNWKKALEKFRDHEQSVSHKFSIKQLQQFKQSKPVDHMLDAQISDNQQ